jgi:hypothetical protein
MIVDPSAHPQHTNVLKHPCICLECMWEPFHVGLGSQSRMHHDIICSQGPRYYPGVLPSLVIAEILGQQFLNALHMFGVHVGTIPCESEASTNAPFPSFDTLTAHMLPVGIQLVPKVRVNKYGGNGMMVDPSVHPQHMNVLEHCGKHSMSSWALIQCSLTSLVL